MLSADTPTPDSYRIRTEADKQFYIAGIPSEFWVQPKHDVQFRSYELWDSAKIVPSDHQETWWKRLQAQENLFQQPHLIYMCCRHNDTRAMDASFRLAKLALMKGLRIQVDNAATANTRPQVVEPVAILYNVADEATIDRKQRIRDWIRAYGASFRVIASSGDPAKLHGLLGIQPTLAFSVSPNLTISL